MRRLSAAILLLASASAPAQADSYLRLNLPAPLLMSPTQTEGPPSIEGPSEVTLRVPATVSVPYTFRHVAGAPQFTDNSDLLDMIPGAGGGTLTGTLESSLEYVMSVSSGGRQGPDKTVSFTVFPQLVASVPATLGPFDAGQPISIVPQLSGKVGAVTWTYQGDPRLTVDPRTGTLTGTVDEAVTLQGLALTATDDADDKSDTVSFDIQVVARTQTGTTTETETVSCTAGLYGSVTRTRTVIHYSSGPSEPQPWGDWVSDCHQGSNVRLSYTEYRTDPYNCGNYRTRIDVYSRTANVRYDGQIARGGESLISTGTCSGVTSVVYGWEYRPCPGYLYGQQRRRVGWSASQYFDTADPWKDFSCGN